MTYEAYQLSPTTLGCLEGCEGLEGDAVPGVESSLCSGPLDAEAILLSESMIIRSAEFLSDSDPELGSNV